MPELTPFQPSPAPDNPASAATADRPHPHNSKCRTPSHSTTTANSTSVTSATTASAKSTSKPAASPPSPAPDKNSRHAMEHRFREHHSTDREHSTLPETDNWCWHFEKAMPSTALTSQQRHYTTSPVPEKKVTAATVVTRSWPSSAVRRASPSDPVVTSTSPIPKATRSESSAKRPAPSTHSSAMAKPPMDPTANPPPADSDDLTVSTSMPSPESISETVRTTVSECSKIPPPSMPGR